MDFDGFLKEVCPELDLDWRKYRKRSARRRIARRMAELGLDDLADYLKYVRSNSTEAEALPGIMFVTVSRFFRDRCCWDGLMEEILPHLARRGSDLRVLSAGCCGGEEPYSMAIAWLEYRMRAENVPEMEIIAVDLDASSLRRAEEARYDWRSLREVPAELLERWFVPERSRWRVVSQVTSMIRFEEWDLTAGELPEGLDMILCRYLFFTYFLGGRRLEMVRRFWRALRPGGVLFIGGKERLVEEEIAFFIPSGLPSIYYRRS